MLSECRASIRSQNVLPLEHLVEIDQYRSGPSFIVNRLASFAKGDWVLPFADDDLLDPDFLSTLSPHMESADIVYGWCRVEGSRWSPNRLYRPGTLKHGNYIPATALIRKSLWDHLNGYRFFKGKEDWDLWLRAEAEGARFVCVPEVIWTYRQHGANLFNDVTEGAINGS